MVLNEGSLVFDDGCWEGGCEGGGGGNGGGTSTGTMPEPTIRNDFIVGTTGMDTIHLLDGNDYYRGLDGNDHVFGDAGNDRLFGEGGKDTIDGGQGNDRLFGGEGRDVLIGGPGNDVLTGGGGADRFVFDTGSGARDVIRYFSVAEGDRIDLSGQTYAVRTAGDGDVILDLSGGGHVRLDHITLDAFGDGGGFFV